MKDVSFSLSLVTHLFSCHGIFFASKESDMMCEIHLLLLKTLFENLENQLSCLCKGYHDLHTHVWVVSRFDSPLYWVPGVWSPGSEGWVLGGTHHELKHHCNYLNFGMFYLWFKHNYFQDVAWFCAGRCWGEGNLQQHKAVYPLHGVIQHWRGCVHFCCGCSRHARNSYTCMYLHTHTLILLILSFQKFIGNNCGLTSCTHLGCIFLAYVSGVQLQLGSCVP